MAAAVTGWQTVLLSVSNNILSGIFGFLPNLLGAIIVFLVGWILADWLRTLVIKLLTTLQLSHLVKTSGFNKFLEKAEIKLKVEEILGGTVKWLVILIFSVTAVNILGLTTVSAVLAGILGYLPKIISAVLVLTVGILLAGVVESLTKGAVGQFDVRMGRLLGKAGSWMVGVFAVLAAVNELGIAQNLINTLFIGFVAMLALGFGLAIGLGAKDLVAEILREAYENFKKELKNK